MSKVLVTGATGFVGRALCAALDAAGHETLGVTRGNAQPVPGHRIRMQQINQPGEASSWAPLLNGVDYVFHLAARVHVMQETAEDPLQAFRSANVSMSEALAHASIDAGAKRLVFLSTIKVLGEKTSGQPYRSTDAEAPADPYSISKHEAEQALRRLTSASPTELVIVRPPLIYGPGVRGNMQRVFRLVQKRVPLPLASIHNKRSMLGLENLCDFLLLSLQHPRAAGQAFLVADEEPLSTPELFEAVARAMRLTPRLFPMPPMMLRAAGMLLHRSAEIERLCGDLVLDTSHTKHSLGWSPRVSSNDGLRVAVEHFLAREHSSD